MKEYLIKWCEDSDMYFCPVTQKKTYFVGDCLQEIAKDAEIDISTWGIQSESHLLYCLKRQGLSIKLIDIATQQEIEWEN